MDEMTQQNAALVEQAAAAAESMEEQAIALGQAVSVFKLVGNTQIKTSIAPVKQTLSKSNVKAHPKVLTSDVAATKQIKTKSKPTSDDADAWEEF